MADSRPYTTRHGGPSVTVADSAQTAVWLEDIAARACCPWQVRQLDRNTPQGVLVLAQPGDFPAALHHWITANQVVVSLDSPRGRSLALSNRVRTFTFSEGRDSADLTAKDLRLTREGLLRFVAVTRSALTRVTVEPDQLYPALAAMACAVWLGAPLELAGETVSAGAVERCGKAVRMA